MLLYGWYRGNRTTGSEKARNDHFSYFFILEIKGFVSPSNADHQRTSNTDEDVGNFYLDFFLQSAAEFEYCRKRTQITGTEKEEVEIVSE